MEKYHNPKETARLIDFFFILPLRALLQSLGRKWLFVSNKCFWKTRNIFTVMAHHAQNQSFNTFCQTAVRHFPQQMGILLENWRSCSYEEPYATLRRHQLEGRDEWLKRVVVSYSIFSYKRRFSNLFKSIATTNLKFKTILGNNTALCLRKV